MPGEFRKRELIDDVLVVSHLVDDENHGARADQFLQKHYKHFSRNQLQKLIASGRILILDRSARLKPATKLLAGQVIQVQTKQNILVEPKVNFDYKILFEDDAVLVVDKPGNLPVHPAGKFLFHTLLMNLRQERADWVKQGNDFYLIHRIDRETSGVLLLAKTQAAAGILVKQFRERATAKKYLAICHGTVKQDRFTVEAEIGPATNSAIRLKMAAYPQGSGHLAAHTSFKVLKRTSKVSLLECELFTGRQHQIRVHLDYVGHAIVGDKLYGQEEQVFLNYIQDRENLTKMGVATLPRHALHSCSLQFEHPISAKTLTIESALPNDMQNLMNE